VGAIFIVEGGAAEKACIVRGTGSNRRSGRKRPTMVIGAIPGGKEKIKSSSRGK
jgi:hypothetical protein